MGDNGLLSYSDTPPTKREGLKYLNLDVFYITQLIISCYIIPSATQDRRRWPPRAFVSRAFEHSRVLLMNGAMFYGCSDGRGVTAVPGRDDGGATHPTGLLWGGCATSLCLHTRAWSRRLTISAVLLHRNWARW